VDYGDVTFLYPGGVIGGDDQRDVADRLDAAAVFAQQADGGAAGLAGHLQRLLDIWRVAAGGDADDRVARDRQRLDLAGKDPLKAVIVADGGYDGGIG
jgi:hypothetical protein